MAGSTAYIRWDAGNGGGVTLQIEALNGRITRFRA
jgi:hypothetical protein